MAKDCSSSYSASNWNKFLLILWKNFILQWRHKVQLVFEIAIPLVFFGFLLLMRQNGRLNSEDKPTIFPSFTINSLEALKTR